MKYVAIIKYSFGTTVGVNIEADNSEAAWKKLIATVPMGGALEVTLAEESYNK